MAAGAERIQPVRAYALTTFFGAFLLFQVQPLIGKFILPWYGGGPGVWTTCLLFFQGVLLGGYAYAHLATRLLRPRGQAVLHLALLAGAVALLPIVPNAAWKPQGGGDPTLQILALLSVTLGLPYFVLSTTGPLVQQWLSRTHPGQAPYRLYALSNAGSLLALLSYPFVFEAHLSRRAQALWWGVGLVGYALACGFCAVRLWKSAPNQAEARPQPTSTSAPKPRPSPLVFLWWVLFPAATSMLLMAMTNKLCQDVAAIPFLWVVPLALYLLSFIICFDHPRWYQRTPFTFALIAALAGVTWAMFRGEAWPLWQQVVVYGGGLFICCLVGHGELYRLRPEPERLTSYYLMIAAGGVLGGVFVAVAAPLLFRGYFELHWGLLLCAFLFLLVCATEGTFLLPPRPDAPPTSWKWMASLLPLIVFGGLDRLIVRLGEHAEGLAEGWTTKARAVLWLLLALVVVSWIARRRYRTFRYWRLLACAWLVVGLEGLIAALGIDMRAFEREALQVSRNFYGVLSVRESGQPDDPKHYFLLKHGRIIHGLQCTDPQKVAWPTTYFGEASGVGLAFKALAAGPRRLGVIGLGVGTLATYAAPGDSVRFYEINPEVKHLAETRFSFLSQCAGRVEVVLGDARLSLEREPPQEFDLLALDAFSGDAIPVHLLTKEAFELYGRHLRTNGVIVVHITNHFLDLEPVILNLARHCGYEAVVVNSKEAEERWWLFEAKWMVLSRNAALLNSAALAAAAQPPSPSTRTVPLWTDDFASLFQILK